MKVPDSESNSRIGSAIALLGSAISKPRKGVGRLHPLAQHAFNFVFLAALFSTFVLCLAAPTFEFFERSFSSAPDFPIKNSSWHVLYSTSRSLMNSRTIERAPPLDLWESASTLEDSDLLEKLRSSQGSTFWVGTNISTNTVPRNLRNFGSVLVIGHLNGSHEIYVNNRLRKTGDGLDYLPAEIVLNADDFNSSAELRVAIKVNHDLGSTFPVAINMPYVTGIFSFNAERSLRDLWTTILVLMPIAFAVTFAIASAMFLSLWLSVRNRNEYFVFSMFLFCLFLTQLRTWGAIKHGMPRTQSYVLDFCLRFLEGTVAGFLGASYSRARVGVYLLISFIGICYATILLRSSELISDLNIASSILARNYVPFGFFTGALFCWSQFLVGKNKGFDGMTSVGTRVRLGRLLNFSLLMIGLGILYCVQARGILSTDHQVYFHRPAQFLLISLIGIFLLRDMRSFDILQERSYLSKFHDPTNPDSSVFHGLLVEVDMKGSSRLYELSTNSGQAKEIPTIWNEAAISAVHSGGGAILTTEGDAFRAFFEGPTEVALVKALRCLSVTKSLGKELEPLGGTIEFRATIVAGSIKAIYKELGGKIFEDFEHAPGSSCFKDAARILATEKLQNLEGSILVIETALWDRLREPPKFFYLEKIEGLNVKDVGHRSLSFIRISDGGTSKSSAA